ncbi:MAG: hypothetical protein WAM96_11565 [Candidatus Acidiferrales bacterium]
MNKKTKAALTKLHEAVYETDKALVSLGHPVALQLAVEHLQAAADELSQLLGKPPVMDSGTF